MIPLGNEVIVGRWHDSLAYTGTAGEPVEQHSGPKNKRPVPCEGCALKSFCASSEASCAPFRAWVERGDYKDEYDNIQLKIDNKRVKITPEIVALLVNP